MCSKLREKEKRRGEKEEKRERERERERTGIFFREDTTSPLHPSEWSGKIRTVAIYKRNMDYDSQAKERKLLFVPNGTTGFRFKRNCILLLTFRSSVDCKSCFFIDFSSDYHLSELRVRLS